MNSPRRGTAVRGLPSPPTAFERRSFLKLLGVGAGALLVAPRLSGANSPALPAPRSLGRALQLAGECSLAWLDPQHEHFPWGGYEVAHDVGRWWNALPRLEAATGFVIPPPLEAAMLHNFWRLTKNEDALLLNDPEIEALRGKKDRINLHNLREGLLAYAALAHYRRNAWARERGRVLVRTMAAGLLPNGGLDTSKLKSLSRISLSPDKIQIQPTDPNAWYDCTGSTGRTLEAVVVFHDVTGETESWELAGRLAAILDRNLLTDDGSVHPGIVAPTNIGHDHSYQGALRGLLLYGLRSGQTRLVERVHATFRHGVLRTLVSESGWSPHDLGTLRFPNGDGDPLAETGSCSDAVQLGLWLGLHTGHVECLDDVERLIRTRILPEQITESEDPRQRGGWGVHREPHGRSSTFDVFAAVLATLVDVQQAAVEARGPATWVHFNLALETPLARIQERRTDRTAHVQVTATRRGDLYVRVPGWAPRESVRVTVEGKARPPRFTGAYLHLASGNDRAGATVEISYDLPHRETVETMPVSGKKFTLTWRGDEVTACTPPVAIWPAAAVP